MSYKDPVAQREYQRLWMQKRRSEFFSDKACEECGSTDRLELDHIDPKDKTTHKIWSWSAERRDAEIAKCQVLCAECHKEKTRAQRPPARHGYGMYKRGCRCELCVTRNRDQTRLYRLRKAQREAGRVA